MQFVFVQARTAAAEGIELQAFRPRDDYIIIVPTSRAVYIEFLQIYILRSFYERFPENMLLFLLLLLLLLKNCKNCKKALFVIRQLRKSVISKC